VVQCFDYSLRSCKWTGYDYEDSIKTQVIVLGFKALHLVQNE